MEKVGQPRGGKLQAGTEFGAAPQRSRAAVFLLSPPWILTFFTTGPPRAPSSLTSQLVTWS